ncbi:Chromosome partition protein Smc [Labrenzia sp. THAF82]|uniref:YhaN family protein n=1 Tax=Labrenzia sp. THAF82 TaxID=2587861 RepID=UPI0012687ED9|nr:YhaN family protein [Labrenzia sp. THAF82]QFT31926.1 Chromosome partition protein Smc [Labrenzia sp. THAF82]
MMRLEKLTLDFFGHFTGKSYDFGAKSSTSDFHVIYGPNEAGKTTTMEAFLRLLYGFPHQDRYDFLHQRKNLRVSGVLDVDGNQVPLTRLSTRDPSLRDANDTPLPEVTLAAHLGGLSETDYRHLLCLDDETIEKGGEEIVNSKGDIGRLLFSAAAGVSDLTAVLDQFRAKADGIYRKRATSTEMAQLKRQLADVEQEIRETDVPVSAYKKLKQALEVAQVEEASAREERKTLLTTKADLEAFKAALPKLAEIDTLEAELTDYADFPKLLDVNPEELVTLLTEQTRLLADKDRIGQEITQLRDQLVQLERHPEHLSLMIDLERLDELRSRFATADIDLDKRRRTLAEIQQDMSRAATNLDAPETIDLKALVLSPGQIGQLEAARDNLRTSSRDITKLETEIEDLQERVGIAEQDLAEIQSDNPTVVLVSPILTRYSIDSLSPRYASARQAVRSATNAREDALTALTVSGQVFDAIPLATISSVEAEELSAKYRTLQDKRSKLADRCEDLKADLRALEHRVSALKSGAGVVDDATAQTAKEERNQLWSAHKSTLDLTSAIAFETAMQKVDQLSETRLDHTTELGRLRAEEQRQSEVETKLSSAKEHLAKLDEELAEVRETVDGYASRCGLSTSLSTEVFSVWVRKLEAAIQADTNSKRLEKEHQTTLSDAQRAIAELQKAMGLATEDFDALIVEARTRRAEELTRDEKRKAAFEVCKGLKAELVRQRQAMSNLQNRHEGHQKTWSTMISEFFGSALTENVVIQSLEPLRELREMEGRRVGMERQVVSMEKDQQDFGREVALLAEPLGVDVSLSPLEIFKALQKMSRAASEAEQTFRTLSKNIQTAKDALSKTEKALENISRKAADLAAIFPQHVPTDTLQDLRKASGEAQNVIDKRARLLDLCNSVRSELSMPDIEAAREKLKGKTLVDLDASLMALNDDLGSVDKRLESSIEQRTSAQKDLSAVTGEADIASLVERKTTLEFEIEEAALSYLETTFGLHLAEEAIRRYRDRHRSGMMDATEKAFAELTNGAYNRLETRPEGSSEILLAIDASGTAKQANDLSKGTRFQLFLALRAAAYEQLATQGVCLPFFCDDVFETFDEDRTRSACKVMEKIGRTGQAIYLTHHRHVVELAKEVCVNGVSVHEL